MTTRGMNERERIAPAQTHHHQAAKKVAEPVRQLGVKFGGAQRQEARREGGPLGPYDRAAVPGHRQDGEGPGWKEMLDGDAKVGPLVPDRADYGGLRVAPFHGADPGGAAQRRERAVGGD